VAVAGGWHPASGPEGFLAATVDQARLVRDAEDGGPTYDAGVAFQGLAMGAMAGIPEGEYLAEILRGKVILIGPGLTPTTGGSFPTGSTVDGRPVLSYPTDSVYPWMRRWR